MIHCLSVRSPVRDVLHFLAGVAVLLASLSLYSQSRTQQQGVQAGAFATPVTLALIDNSASAEWIQSDGGAIHPLPNPVAVRQILWTQTGGPAGTFLSYGAGTQPGTRKLRIGFTSPVAVGSILSRGGDQISVLRPNAAYPGDLADDSQWLPAENIMGATPSADEVDRNSYGLWVLPPGTKTRALRFTHNAQASDKTYGGTVGGIYLLASRYANLAPQAAITTSANSAAIPLLTDAKENGWRSWDNGPDYRHAVTRATPEWITLTWPQPVSLSGLGLLWAGLNSADAQYFSGGDTVSPQGASEADWKAIGPALALRNQYPRPLGIDWLDFGRTLQTRAIRLRITSVTDESHHPHLANTTRSGNRVWLGEVMAISPLGSTELKAAALASSVAKAGATAAPAFVKALAANPNLPKPPIPVRFTLDAPGYVTLVIEDAQGNRVRNLVSDTYFEAGANTAWWDGTDDLGRNPDAAAHGVYLIPTHFVAPGHYQVRGLVHKAIDLHYEFSVYTGGHPAWETADTTGGWLTNHTPPSSTLFVPADKAPGGKPLVYLGSYVAEGGSGLAWVDLDGKKQGGRAWIGGAWTGAPYLARDTGSIANPAIFAYVGAVWGDANAGSGARTPRAVLRLTGLTAHGDKAILNYPYDPGDSLDHNEKGGPNWMPQMGGLAVHNNLAVISLVRQQQLLFIDTSAGKSLGLAPVESPRGLAFDAQGNLLTLSGQRLIRYRVQEGRVDPQQLPQPEVVITAGLEDPAGITLDVAGNIYISDRGTSNQVKVFSPTGKLLRSIGHSGKPQAGPYDPEHMNNPRGLAIDSNNHLWVAEDDFQPKRVSVWSLDERSGGGLVKAFYGPSEYGGGGTLDPNDPVGKSRFYYHGMEFKLDWNAGTDSLASVLYRQDKDALQLPYFAKPGTVVYGNGHRYFTSTYQGNEIVGSSIAFLYLEEGGVLRLASAFGRANDWKLLASDEFKPLWPQKTDVANRSADNSVLFTWSDTNSNGRVDPSEVTFLKSSTGAVTLMPDLALTNAFVEGNAVRYAPVKFTPAGVPVYDLNSGTVIATGAQKPASDGGGQVLYSPQATVLTTAPSPFAREGVGGIYSDSANKSHRWSYPSLWPGLHPSHTAPSPDRPGELIGTTRLLGGFVTPPKSDAGPLWSINGNYGDMFVFTADGLYVTQLFQDIRTGKPWSSPLAQRNMLLNDVTLSGENFYPSINQTSDGNIYLVDGARTSVVRVDGLSSIHRIAPSSLDLTAVDLQKAQGFQKQSELSRQATSGPKILQVTLRSNAPALKDLVSTLNSADWATIDERITQNGWNRAPNLVQGALTIAGGRLYAAFRTNEASLLTNSGAVANAPFKTGGALDLMLGTDLNADPKRAVPAQGDLRLLVYQVSGATRALLYRAVAPGTTNPVPFSSPARTITIDQVTDVSSAIQFDASGAAGTFVFSIPLSTLGLKPVAGQRIKGDIGILRGSSGQTQQRVYWSNKATGITSDVPSEAELTPNLWGQWVFTTER